MALKYLLNVVFWVWLVFFCSNFLNYFFLSGLKISCYRGLLVVAGAWFLLKTIFDQFTPPRLRNLLSLLCFGDGWCPILLFRKVFFNHFVSKSSLNIFPANAGKSFLIVVFWARLMLGFSLKPFFIKHFPLRPQNFFSLLCFEPGLFFSFCFTICFFSFNFYLLDLFRYCF